MRVHEENLFSYLFLHGLDGVIDQLTNLGFCSLQLQLVVFQIIHKEDIVQQCHRHITGTADISHHGEQMVHVLRGLHTLPNGVQPLDDWVQRQAVLVSEETDELFFCFKLELWGW
jgi:hypothetical protein